MNRPQLDMFAAEDDLFPAAPVVYRADPDRVRRKLERMLAEARAGEGLAGERRRLFRTLVPQMVLALPDEEATQYRLAFEAEMGPFSR